MTVRTLDTLHRLTPWKTRIFLYPCILLFTLTHFGIQGAMETTNSSNNNIDLVNTEEVNILDENGLVTETFHFPVTTPIVIAESSDTEAEEEVEKQEENDKKKEKEVEVGEDKEEPKVRRVFDVCEPTPQRMSRSNPTRSNVPTLQPAPTTTPSPVPSDMFPPPQIPTVQEELQLITDLHEILATPALIPIALSCPSSPLPKIDFTMDIIECFETETTQNLAVEALEAIFLQELPDFTVSDVESIVVSTAPL